MSDTPYDQIKVELCEKCGWAMKFPGKPCRCELKRESNQLRAQLAEAESSLKALRAECLRLSRENVELRRGAPLERVLSPNDSRVTDYTD